MKHGIITALLMCTLLSAGVAVLFTGCGKGAHEETNVKAAKYHCPMHPTVVSDKPGDCPICGMRLVPMGEGEQAAVPATKTMYRSTMNPGEVSDKPGKDSMGMDMVPFEVTAGESASTVPGQAVVSSAASPSPIGTSFIPQIGQSPGLSETIVGCIGQ